MAEVEALKPCYIGRLREVGDKFSYDGPPAKHLKLLSGEFAPKPERVAKFNRGQAIARLMQVGRAQLAKLSDADLARALRQAESRPAEPAPQPAVEAPAEPGPVSASEAAAPAPVLPPTEPAKPADPRPAGPRPRSRRAQKK